MNVAKILKKLGLSEKEAFVYLALLKTGLAGAARIAREAALARQTTYSLLADLVEKGFIEQSDRKGVRQFYADPNELIKLVGRQRDELEKERKILEQELPKLLVENKRATALPIVQYYEGQEGMKRLFVNILEQYKKGKLKLFRGLGINRFYGGMEDTLREFVEKRSAYGVRTNLLIANAPDNFGIHDEQTALGRNVRRLNIDEQQAGIYLVGNSAYFFSYKDNVGVMLENQAIVKFLQDTFDALWEKTPGGGVQ